MRWRRVSAPPPTTKSKEVMKHDKKKRERFSRSRPSGRGEETSKKKSGDGANEYKVIVPLLNVREKASMASEVIGTLLEGETVHISARTPQGFGKLDGEGYVKLEFVEKADEAGEPE